MAKRKSTKGQQGVASIEATEAIASVKTNLN
jgi:hypothetical protein